MKRSIVMRLPPLGRGNNQCAHCGPVEEHKGRVLILHGMVNSSRCPPIEPFYAILAKGYGQ